MLIGGVMAGRAITLGAAVVAGLVLCASFPPLDWWWPRLSRSRCAIAAINGIVRRPRGESRSGRELHDESEHTKEMPPAVTGGISFDSRMC
jgi:hypothetical protein